MWKIFRRQLAYDDRTCSCQPSNPDSDIYLQPRARLSCTGPNVVSLNAVVSEETIVGEFWIRCDADFPMDIHADGEMSFKWAIALSYWDAFPRVFHTKIEGRSALSAEWSTARNSIWNLSNNYTIYSVAEPHVNITFELNLASVALATRTSRAEYYGWSSKVVHLELYFESGWSRTIVKCLSAGGSDGDHGFIAVTTGTNPTETRMMLPCLKSKKSDCAAKIIYGLEHFPFNAILEREHGVVYCKREENEKFVEYFSPVNQPDIYTNMSLIWEDRHVIHIQINDGLDTFNVTQVNIHENGSYKGSVAAGKKAKSVKMLETEYLDFECHFLEYILKKRILWFAVYANGTEKIILNSYANKERKQYNSGEYLNEFPISSSHARVQGIAGMIAVKCEGSYWNYARNATATFNLTIIKISETEFPWFNISESSHDATIGAPLLLDCTADYGDPRPTYAWRFYAKEGSKKMLAPNETESSYTLPAGSSPGPNDKNGSTLTIHGFRVDMEGTYVCIAKNIRANASSRFEVKLQQEPVSWNTAIYLSVCFGVIFVMGIMLITVCRKYYMQRGRLTSMEIKLFEKGNIIELDSAKLAHENAPFMPYNRDYEIKWSEFKIFDDEKLGQGEFGVVFKGCLTTFTSTAIAVKTVKSGAEKSVILALLSELKVMIHLGKHENVVRLIGACTGFLREGRVYVLMEFCALGSLHSYLRKADRNQFRKAKPNTDYSNTSDVPNLDYDRVDGLTEMDLLGWAVQIARGMQYLESKKVIHGDLAARNVLLMSKAHAKITDFGLSRQLMNYENYVRKSQCKLPWRWLALESLKSLVFTHKSDVWSYGITLWEIYTLGLVPYTGMAWNSEFVDHLENDLRLHKPKFAPDYIYKIMTSCWEVEPGNRPDFQQLELVLMSYKA